MRIPRALQVAEDRDRTGELVAHLTDEPDGLGVLLVRPVREVDPGDVHAACISAWIPSREFDAGPRVQTIWCAGGAWSQRFGRRRRASARSYPRGSGWASAGRATPSEGSRRRREAARRRCRGDPNEGVARGVGRATPDPPANRGPRSQASAAAKPMVTSVSRAAGSRSTSASRSARGPERPADARRAPAARPTRPRRGNGERPRGARARGAAPDPEADREHEGEQRHREPAECRRRDGERRAEREEPASTRTTQRAGRRSRRAIVRAAVELARRSRGISACRARRHQRPRRSV
jgi:hypothetical protein